MKVVQFTFVRVPLAAILFFALITSLLVTTAGCGGGTTMEDMKRRAIRRPKDDEDETFEWQEVAKIDNADKTSPSANPVNSAPVNSAPINSAPVNSAVNQQPTKPISDTAAGNRQISTSPNSSAERPNQTQQGPSTLAAVIATAAAVERPQTPAARRQMTIDNMKRISNALVQYVSEKNVMPGQATTDSSKQPLLSWRVSILPQLGLDYLYNQFHHQEPWDSPHNSALLAKIPPVFQSPERFDTSTNYQVPIASSSLFPPRKVVAKRRVEDGLANTVMLLEVDDAAAVPWTKPADHQVDPGDLDKYLGGLRQDGFLLGWGDGSVMVCTKNILGMYTIDGGEPINRDQLCKPAVALLATASPTVRLGSASTSIGPILSSNSVNSPSSASTNSLTNENNAELNVPTEFLSQARDAWSDSREQEARQLQMTSIALGEIKRNDPDFLRWSEALQRPSVFIHWGLAIYYAGPRLSDPEPIRPAKENRAEKQALPKLIDLATGELGPRVVDLLGHHFSQGSFGRLPQDAPGDLPNGRDNRGRNTDKDEPKVRVPISPGLMLVAANTPNTLIKIARLDKLDAMILFEIKCKLLDGRTVYNTTTIRVVDVAGGTTLFSTKPLNNIRVERERADPLKEDPVSVEFERLSEFLGNEFALTAQPPTITSEEAKARIARMTPKQLDEPMAALAATEYYHQHGLLSGKELLQARTYLVGEDAAISISMGEPEEKRRTILMIKEDAERQR